MQLSRKEVTVVQPTGTNLHSVIDSGSVTADAGTNLNTSALALETTLQSVKTAVEVIDNCISGSEAQVDVVTSALPAGASTSANQSTIIGHVDGIEGLLTTIDADTGNIVTAVQLIDNAISGAGFNITQMNGVNVTMGNGTSDTGVQRVSIASDSTGNIATIGTSVTPGTGSTNLGKAEDAAHASGHVGVMALAVRDDTCGAMSGTEGDYEPFHTDSIGRLWTDPQGNVAHDAADSGNPVKIGAKAISSPSGLTMVAANDRTDIYTDLDGVQIVKLDTSGADVITEAVSNTDGASTAFTNFGATASTYNYITSYVAFRTDTGTTMAYIDIRNGTAGSVLHRIPLPAGGGSISPGKLIIKSSANTALAFDVSSALTTVYISVSGFKSKV